MVSFIQVQNAREFHKLPILKHIQYTHIYMYLINVYLSYAHIERKYTFPSFHSCQPYTLDPGPKE